jgi:hypothetical protein
MSLRYEQYYALLRTREFMRKLLWEAGKMKTSEIKQGAGDCLHHFPHLDDKGQPFWSQDPFTDDRIDVR